MSSVYVLEPPTKGKVVLNTSAGPLDIELWPKEAPKAVSLTVLFHHEFCHVCYFSR
jgi:cyclophilin family peptidyl-prolyl cis-trans isomerase